MHVGIVIHSQSGHTSSLARAIALRLREHGHEVDIELLRPKGSVNPLSRNVTFLKLPALDPEQVDVLLVGGPVWLLSASPVIMAYIDSLPGGLRGKKLMGFVTYALPVRIFGERGLSQMRRALMPCCGDVLDGEAVFYPPWARQGRIDECAAVICERIAGAEGP